MLLLLAELMQLVLWVEVMLWVKRQRRGRVRHRVTCCIIQTCQVKRGEGLITQKSTNTHTHIHTNSVTQIFSVGISRYSTSEMCSIWGGGGAAQLVLLNTANSQTNANNEIYQEQNGTTSDTWPQIKLAERIA
jgi:hypothetical protein